MILTNGYTTYEITEKAQLEAFLSSGLWTEVKEQESRPSAVEEEPKAETKAVTRGRKRKMVE